MEEKHDKEEYTTEEGANLCFDCGPGGLALPDEEAGELVAEKHSVEEVEDSDEETDTSL